MIGHWDSIADAQKQAGMLLPKKWKCDGCLNQYVEGDGSICDMDAKALQSGPYLVERTWFN